MTDPDTIPAEERADIPPTPPEHEGDGSRGSGAKQNVQIDPEDQRARPDPKTTGHAPRRS